MKKNQPDFSQWLETTQFSGGNLEYLESIYDDYITGNREGLDPEWLSFFGSVAASTDTVHRDTVKEFKDLAKNKVNTIAVAGDSDITLKAKSLLKAYRSHAYKSAKIDPLNITEYVRDTDLDLSTH